MKRAGEPLWQQAWIGLGSNQGDRLALVRLGRAELAATEGVRLEASSALYCTAPVGGPAGQADFYNAVVQLATCLSPLELLRRCLAIEQRAGRKRLQHWGPRTLDLDLLLYDDATCITTAELCLPHPRLHQRAFVLRPLCDLVPRQRHPGLGRSLTELLAALPAGPAVVRLRSDW